MLCLSVARARPGRSRRISRPPSRNLPQLRKPAPQPVPGRSGSPAGKEPRAKSLTLRLSETQYERLRRFAFERRLSHQDIIESALLGYLDQQERSA